MLDGYVEFWKRYVDFSGLTTRKNFWVAIIINWVIVMILNVLPVARVSAGTSEFSVLATIFGLAILIPTIAVTIRRLHDTGRSGWFYLLNLIPFVGSIIVLVLCALPAKTYDNPWNRGSGYYGQGY